MSYIIFKRESNKFNDILTDNVLKKNIRTKISFSEHLILEFKDDESCSYAILKYGDDIISMNHIVPDRTPVMDRDYAPDRNNGYWRKRQKPKT